MVFKSNLIFIDQVRKLSLKLLFWIQNELKSRNFKFIWKQSLKSFVLNNVGSWALLSCLVIIVISKLILIPNTRDNHHHNWTSFCHLSCNQIPCTSPGQTKMIWSDLIPSRPVRVTIVIIYIKYSKTISCHHHCCGSYWNLESLIWQALCIHSKVVTILDKQATWICKNCKIVQVDIMLLGDIIEGIGVTTVTPVTSDHGGLGLVNIKFNWYQILLLSISFQSSSLAQSILVSMLCTTCSSLDRFILSCSAIMVHYRFKVYICYTLLS